ncbi:MAG: hypothetical protein OXM55_01215 [Bdellovibrionales bacterium]|nr:hypothetical protein [Bdellovibrionales bacterium]
MKGCFLFLFLWVFFLLPAYVGSVCEDTFRRYAYGDADQLLFLRNFKVQNIRDKNVWFIVMQSAITEFIPLSIAKIMQKTGEGNLRVQTSELAVHEMVIETNGSFSFTVGDRRFNRWVKQGKPELKKIFDSLESPKKKISFRELNLPPRTQEESLLRARGYNEAYIRGMDEGNEWIAVAKSLRDLNANAYITHIEYFANKIVEHTEHIKKRLRTLDLSYKDKVEKWDKIKLLEEQAEMRMESESVTYSWWIKFNYELVSLLGSELVSRYDIDTVLSFFPISILMPTTIGELGIITMNKVTSHGVDPVGVVNTYKYVDAVGKVSPQYFFLHDVGHAISGIMKRVRASYNDQLYEKLMEAIKNETIEKRKNVEFAYFTLMHEVRRPYIDMSPNDLAIYISRMFAQQIRTGVRFKGIIDFTQDVETDLAITSIIDDFVEAYSIAMKETGREIY